MPDLNMLIEGEGGQKSYTIPKAKILIVEDEGIVAYDMQTRLNRLGYPKPDIALTGKDAVEKALATHPDLILMDVMMPGEIDGIMAAEKIHAHFDIPIIYITAYADENTIKRAKITEPFGYIVKPFRERELQIAIDIALYKHGMENKLRESEEQYRQIIETANEGIIVTDKDGRINLVNRKMADMLGYTIEELLGKASIDFMPEDQKKLIFDFREKLGNKEQIQSEFCFRRKDGSLLWTISSAAPILNGKGEHIGNLEMHTDITDRKKAEDTLRETKDYLDKLLNYANAPIIVWNPDMRISLFNHAFEKLTGYTSDEVIGRELKMLFPPASKKQSFESITRASKGEYLETVEIPIRRKDDKVRTVLWNSANIVASDNVTIVATIAQGQDITDRKKAEEKLIETNKELEQFAYVASHDLQEPLRTVNSFAELLERRYKNQLDDKANEFIGFIVDGAERMQRLIQDLLAFSRAGRTNTERGNINCNNIVDRIIINVKKSYKESGAIITHDDLPVLFANETSITQLFQNLITNAVKFKNKGGLPKVHISAHKMDHEWLFSVKDNGIGINQKYFEKLFVIFQRLHGRQEYPGTGMGLAICKKIVESYNGRIWVESIEGEGSTFHFTFPV